MTDNSLHDNASYRQLSFPYIYGENIERNYPDVQLSIERITPEVAQKMLGANIKNRQIKKVPIDAIKEVINNGEWALNGETIIFDKLGRLSDGQHRLISCVRTGKPIVAVIVRGVEEDVQDTIDNGTRRQLSDYLKIDGYKNYTDVAAIGRVLMRKEDLGICPTLFDSNNTKRSIKSMRRFIRDCHDERIESLVHYISAVTSKYKFVSQPMLGALFDEFRKAGDDDFDEFVSQLTNKSAAGIPIRLLQLKLNDHASEGSRGRGKYKNSTLAAYFIKTWNAYMRGDNLKRLTYSPGGKHPESFPEIFLGYE